jgi:23S rRNA (cytidine2498-2'-O)-methyltransferase
LDEPRFLFITCQVGAEPAVKADLARRWPAFRFAYSRPGFLTFKLPEAAALTPDFSLESPFVRAQSLSLGKVAGEPSETLAKQVWELVGNRPVRRVHVWQRDLYAPGEHGFEPRLTEADRDWALLMARHAPHPRRLARFVAAPGDLVAAGDLVLDCVGVTSSEWWIGVHEASADVATQTPGGMFEIEPPPDAVSRAFLKMEEALRWSQFPIGQGSRCVEIGSAPGGASQALLLRGAEVIGVDPAEMHPTVLSNPRFTHFRKRTQQVRRREFRKARWLTADMNVAPQYTLDAVEGIVTHAQVNVRGMLLTLKLFDWSMVDELPTHLGRVGSWGFNVVRVRQLQHNRREVCVAALQQPFRRKPSHPHSG